MVTGRKNCGMGALGLLSVTSCVPGIQLSPSPALGRLRAASRCNGRVRQSS